MDESTFETRTAAFLLFRRLFEAELDRNTADTIAAEHIAGVLTLAHEPSPAISSLAQTLSSALNDEQLASMHAEYMRLFVGPGKLEAPFWESVYLDDRELLFLESTAQVRHAYEHEGLQVHTEGGREAEDALPFQLDFVATLSGRTAEALAAGDPGEVRRLLDVQKDFEANHLANWLPPFAGRAAKATDCTFYPLLCQAVSDFIAADIKAISQMLEASCTEQNERASETPGEETPKAPDAQR